MRGMRIVAAIYASALLASCNEPVAIPSADTAEVPGDSDFETAELRIGHVRTRQVWVPSGYSLVDMNNRGDLLLGAAWLPKGRVRPLAMPFVGRSINNHRQILGPGRKIFTNGRVDELPDPCIPFIALLTEDDGTTREIAFDCSLVRVYSDALAENGDAITYYWHLGVASAMSPYQYFKVWRAAEREWKTVREFELDEHILIHPVISDAGIFAHTMDNSGIARSFVSDGGAYLSGAEACPGSLDANTRVLAINDAGESVGLVYCPDGGPGGVGVRWSREGIPTRLGGSPSVIDNYGNAAGIRDSDGHAVLWLVDGLIIDLSAAAGNQPVNVRKFLKRGQIWGFVGTKPVIWRFGF